MKITKKSIPNILSVIRMLLVPVFILLFFSEGRDAHLWALSVFVIAGITDVVDGYLARKNNWITDIGKLLDPLADKLMQFAAFVCLSIKNTYLIWLVALIAIKEFLFLVGGGYMLKKRKIVVHSLWYGKMSTFVVTVSVCLMIVFCNVQELVITMSLLSAAALVFSLIMYFIKYITIIKKSNSNNERTPL